MKIHSIILASAMLATAAISCSDKNELDERLNLVTLQSTFPEGMTHYSISFKDMTVTFTELNTRETYTATAPHMAASLNISLPTGTYDYSGIINFTQTLEDGSQKELLLRAVGSSVTITGDCDLPVEWFKSTPSQGLLISEIYAAGSPNAAHTGGIRDAYIRIYNNSDRIMYADGLAIVESDFVNSRANDYTVMTPANDRDLNFTVGVIWVIPGGGKDVAIEPGESITLTDQAIDWSSQVEGALDLSGADFEWYDDVAQDTDNPSVPNLEKWFSYSNTVWIMSNQCNRSYALVRFPQGMTVEKYLAEYKGSYDYIHPATGTQLRKEKAYLIPNGWIVDGVNLGNRETYVRGALSSSIDASYACISEKNSDKQRFGKKFIRKVAATTADGRGILQDTDDSASDFILTTAR